MSKFSWLILNLFLLVSALTSWKAMKKLSDPELPAIEQEEKISREPRLMALDATPERKVAAVSLDFDTLWQKSLFNPDRTEQNLLEEADNQAVTPPAEQSDFELTGIAWIGVSGNIKPVAVIKQQQRRSPQRRPATRTTTRRGAQTRDRRPGAQTMDLRPPTAQENEKPLQVIFSVGDKINETGYTLSEINTEENSVFLTRGAEKLELKIEFGSAASSERKSVAVVEAANRQRAREEELARAGIQTLEAPITNQQNAAAQAGNTLGQPPPPPGRTAGRGTRDGRRRPGTRESRDRQGTATAGETAPTDNRRTFRQRPTRQQDDGAARGSGGTEQNQRLQQILRESAERRARRGN